MINSISLWTEQIILTVIIATILEMILPNGKSKKYIKTIIGIYVLFCIISPFVDISEVVSSTDFNLDDYVNVETTSENIDQTSMDKRLEELYLEELEKEIIKNVELQGFTVKKCKVDAELFDKENAGIKMIKLSVNKNKENIVGIEKVEINVGEKVNSETEKINDEDLDYLKESLASYYQISKEIITIN